MNEVRSVVLVSLYLRGLGRCPELRSRSWPAVISALRQSGVSGDAPLCPEPVSAVLQEAGLWEAAVQLHAGDRWAHAIDLVASGRVVTAEDPLYPEPWRVRGGASPAALWRKPGRSALSETPEYLTIVGSRSISRSVRAFAAFAGAAVAESGKAVMSGGAVGVDRAAARAALEAGGSAVELLPCGLSCAAGSSAEQWSLCAPGEGFSTAAAMERNLLLYAAGSRSLVVHARFREGGSWQGACAALRHRIGPIFVREPEPGEHESDESMVAAFRALCALGAHPLSHPSLFVASELPEPLQAGLPLGA